MGLRETYQCFPYLDIQELIEFHAVFDGFEDSNSLHVKETLLETIETTILQEYFSLKDLFRYSDDVQMQEGIENALIRLARGDRKSYSIYKKENIPQPKGRQIYKELYEQGIIQKEESREEPIKEYPGQRIKKELRRYQIEHKIHFCDEATRFWFTFIAPNTALLEKGETVPVLAQIAQEFEKYVSLTFETLSEALIIKTLEEHDILRSGSYWDRQCEIDLLVESADDLIIAGESKWKNHKVCKSVLNSLQKKCERANLNVTHYALFSKSGFSKELQELKDESVLLFSLKDFERLCHD